MAIDVGPGRHHAEHIAVVHQILLELLKQLSDASGIAEVEVQVVDEEQEDAASGVVGRPHRRQDDPLLRRRRRRQELIEYPTAVNQDQRGDFLSDAVFHDLEVVLVHGRHELTILVTHDDIRRHQIDGQCGNPRRVDAACPAPAPGRWCWGGAGVPFPWAGGAGACASTDVVRRLASIPMRARRLEFMAIRSV